MDKINWRRVRVKGYPELLRTLEAREGQCMALHCETVDMLALAIQRVRVLEERLAELEHLVGHDWKIERQATERDGATTTPADIDRQMAAVSQVLIKIKQLAESGR